MENKNTKLHIQIPVQFYLHVVSCLSNDLKIAILENKLVIDDLLSSVHSECWNAVWLHYSKYFYVIF